MPSHRMIHLSFVVVVVSLWSYALFAQYVLHLDPCPLCVFQRLAFALFGAIALVAMVHNPSRLGQRVYGALLFAAAALGAGIAGRHVWLQHLPADQVPACGGMGLDYMLDLFPLAEVIRRTLTGSGECAKVDWHFLGLSMPEWTLLWFIALSAVATWNGWRSSRKIGS
jgi:protein dithiol:quinone oxidoreductase